MGEIEVGEYVRTDKGTIARAISNRYEYKDDYNQDFDNEILSDWYCDEKIIKHSPNIIDLIEVGDYVNGREVRAVYDIGFGKCYCFKNDYGRYYDKTYKIKSIVTKEQFESIKYEVNYENK